MINLSSIRHTSAVVQPPRLLVHSYPGTGKTTFGAGNKRAIFVPFEKGLTGVQVNAFPLIKTWQEYLEAIQALGTADARESFDTVVIDTVDWLEPVIHKEVCRVGKQTNIEGFRYGKGYTLSDDYWRQFVRHMDELNDMGYAVLLLAHSSVSKTTTRNGESYDKVGIKMHKRAVAIVQEWPDAIGYLELENIVVKADGGFSKTHGHVRDSGRVIAHFHGSNNYLSKNRYEGVPDPFYVDKETGWDDFISCVFNKNNKGKK